MAIRCCLCTVIVGWLACLDAGSAVPDEPVQIGFGPQFVFDNWVVDNHWAIRYKRQAVRRVFHQAIPFAGNPVLSGDQPSHLWAARDPESGTFRIYYQANFRRQRKPGESGGQYTTLIAYAESDDGLKWTRPEALSLASGAAE